MRLGPSPTRRSYSACQCDHCGTTFERKNSESAAFCSRACWKAHQNKALVMKACPICGQVFQHEAWQDDRQYCSPACGFAARKARTVSAQMQTCEACGRVFNGGHHRRRFCSAECRRPYIHIAQPPEQRAWRFVRKTPCCWLWTGSINTSGHGRFSPRRSHTIVAHRYIWKLTHGTIPHGLCVLHRCPGGENPACVNPDHLYLGSQADNARDRDAARQRTSSVARCCAA